MQANDVPILILAWRRISVMHEIISSLRIIQPKKVYLSFDGPRLSYPSDLQEIEAVARVVKKEIDWKCTIYEQYLSTNCGTGVAVPKGINWFFETEDFGIILEDDVVVDPSFYQLASFLLDKFKTDDRIGSITASNLLHTQIPHSSSYFFSRFPYVYWGWATWKRAWSNFNTFEAAWHNIDSNKLLLNLCNTPQFSKRWHGEISRLLLDPSECWDYRWMATHWLQGQLVCTPKHSLSINKGYDNFASHTKDKNSILSQMRPMQLPIESPITFQPIYEHECEMISAFMVSPFWVRALGSAKRRLLSLKVV